MKRCALVLVTCFCLAALAGTTASAEQIVLRYAGQLPATHHVTKGDYLFAKLVGEKTNGAVKVDVYPAGQLYKAGAILKAVMSGGIEMGITYNGVWTGSVPLMDIFDICFLFDNYTQVQKAWQGKIGSKLREEMEKKGVKVLGFGAYGDSFGIISKKKAMLMPEDFRGQKLRGNNAIVTDQLRALGATPVGMSSSEVYMALQRGTIDGASSGPTSMVQRKWYEMCQHATIVGAAYSVWPIMINLDVWNKLPANVQQALSEAADEETRYTIEQANQEDAKAEAFLAEKLQVHRLTAEQRAAWEKALAPVMDEFLKRTGKDGETLIQWAKELKQ